MGFTDPNKPRSKGQDLGTGYQQALLTERHLWGGLVLLVGSSQSTGEILPIPSHFP